MKRLIWICIGCMILIGCQFVEGELSSAEIPTPLISTKPPPLIVVPVSGTATPTPIPPPTLVPTPNSNSANITVVPIVQETPKIRIEATRIAFAESVSNIRIVGDVTAQGRTNYVMQGLAGQEMRVSILSPSGDVRLAIQAVEGNSILGAEGNSAEWGGLLPMTGDYTISAVAASADTSYEINITILPLGEVGATDVISITRQHNLLGTLTFAFSGGRRARGEFNVNRFNVKVQGQLLLSANNLDTFSFLDDPNVGLRMIDVNFDGFDDILLQQFVPAGPNIPYLYYLYSPALGQFVRNEAFEVIFAPQLDPLARTITSFERVNAVSGIETIYQVFGNEPVIYRQTSTAITPRGQTIYHVRDSVLGTSFIRTVNDFVTPTNLPVDCLQQTLAFSTVVNSADNYCFLHPADFEAANPNSNDTITLTGMLRGNRSRAQSVLITITKLGGANGRALEQIVADEVARLTGEDATLVQNLSYTELLLGATPATGITGLPWGENTAQVIYAIHNDRIYQLVREPINEPLTADDMQRVWHSLQSTFVFLP